MNENFYKKIMRLFQTHPAYIYPLNLVNRLLTLSGFVLYPVLLVVSAVGLDKRFFAFMFLPAFFFLAMSRIRKLFNSPRLYEMSDHRALMPRDVQGQSLPSSDVCSIFPL